MNESTGVVSIDSIDWLDVIKNDGIYQWSTDEYHPDNNFTMNEFLEMLDPGEIKIYFVDGTYAELQIDGDYYRVDASGDGDSFNHKVEFEII